MGMPAWWCGLGDVALARLRNGLAAIRPIDDLNEDFRAGNPGTVRIAGLRLHGNRAVRSARRVLASRPRVTRSPG